MPVSLDLRVRRPARSGVLVVVSARGDCDVFTSDVLRDELTRQIEAGRERVVVDLTGVGFIDSTGLSVLVRARALLASRHGRMDLVAGGRVHRLLRISALASLFPVHGSLQDALDACRPC